MSISNHIHTAANVSQILQFFKGLNGVDGALPDNIKKHLTFFRKNIQGKSVYFNHKKQKIKVYIGLEGAKHTLITQDWSEANLIALETIDKLIERSTFRSRGK